MAIFERTGGLNYHRTQQQSYSSYLQSRSLLGYLYRRCFLYPRIGRYLHGQVLDYGCGIGDFLKHRKNTIGVDNNLHSIEICLRRGLNARHISGHALDFANQTFSGVVMDNVIEHIDTAEVEYVIRELLRVTQTGGTLLIGIPGKKGYDSDNDHKHYYTEHELIDLFAKFGCQHLRTLYTPLPIRQLGDIIRQHCLYVYFRK